MLFYDALGYALLAVHVNHPPEHPDFTSGFIQIIEQLQEESAYDDKNHLLRVLICFCRNMPKEDSGPAYELLLLTHGYLVGLTRGSSRYLYYTELNSILCSLYNAELLNTDTLQWLTSMLSITRSNLICSFAEALQKLERFLTPSLFLTTMRWCNKNIKKLFIFTDIVSCLNHCINTENVEWLAKYFDQADSDQENFDQDRFDQRLINLHEIFLSCITNELLQTAMFTAMIVRNTDFRSIIESLYYWFSNQNFQPDMPLTQETLENLLAIINSDYPFHMANGLNYLAENKLLTPENRTLLIESPSLIYNFNNSSEPGLFLLFAQTIKCHKNREQINGFYLDQELLQYLDILGRESKGTQTKIIKIIASLETNIIATSKKFLRTGLQARRLFVSFIEERAPTRYDESFIDYVLNIVNLTATIKRANITHYDIVMKLSNYGLASHRNLERLKITCEELQKTETFIWQLLDNTEQASEIQHKRVTLNQSMFDYILTLAPLLARMEYINYEDKFDKEFYLITIQKTKQWLESGENSVLPPSLESIQALIAQQTILEERFKHFVEEELTVLHNTIDTLKELIDKESEQVQTSSPLPIMILESFCTEEARINAIPERVSEMTISFFRVMRDDIQMAQAKTEEIEAKRHAQNNFMGLS